MSLDLVIRTRKRGTCTVFVHGRIDLESSPALWRALQLAFIGVAVVRLDMSEVCYMDSSGVAVMIQGLQRARRNRARLLVSDPSPSVLEALDRLHMASRFDIEG